MSRVPTRPRVFGIGLKKTGTRSLATALRLLGVRTLHKGDMATSLLVDRAAAEGLPLLTLIGEKYDAYVDVEGLVCRFAELDEQYPASKFILTTTEESSWIDSCTKHVRANQERAARGEYTGSWLEIAPDRWRQERRAHEAAVQSYFQDRPDDLLRLDIRIGEGWEKLTPFLGRSTPERTFPWENREGLGTYRKDCDRARLRRRIVFVKARARRKLGRP